MRASVSARIPVAGLTVDEATLREEETSADFPPQVPATAREGTRRNMLGEALLDAASSPEILLQSVALEAAPGDAGGDAGALQVLARIAVTVRGQTHTITVPVSYRLAGGQLTLTGESALRQSELGLTPFSALLGALQVQDEMRVRFRIVARAARSH